MIQLHQFARNKRTINFSPYCLKLETYLRMCELPYEVVWERNPGRGPKGKLPFIVDGEVCLGDSHFIIEYLQEAYGSPVEVELSDKERGVVVSIQRLLEDSLAPVVAYSRWVDESGWALVRDLYFRSVPLPLRAFIAMLIRRKAKKALWDQGIARHSPDEVYAIGMEDVTALARILGDKPFFLGGYVSPLDASAFGVLNNLVHDPVASPLQEHALGFENLQQYCQRMRAQYFSDIG